MSITSTSDARDFSESFIRDNIRPLIQNSVPVYQGSKPKEEDPDFYISILTDEETEIYSGSGVWKMVQSITLVCSIGARDSEDHTRYRSQVRSALMQLLSIQNFTVAQKGVWYGGFIQSIKKANKSGSYGDIFYLETNAKAY